MDHRIAHLLENGQDILERFVDDDDDFGRRVIVVDILEDGGIFQPLDTDNGLVDGDLAEDFDGFFGRVRQEDFPPLPFREIPDLFIS